MRPDEFLRKYGIEEDSSEEEGREHSLQENAWERAIRLHEPNAGTPHDWEDWERASEKLGLDVSQASEEEPTRTKPEAARQIDDQPGPGDWLATWWRRLKRRLRRRGNS